MKIIYIAEDGTPFKNEEDCYYYEQFLRFPEIYNIKFFDEKNKEYHINADSFPSYSIYNNCEALMIHNNAELIGLHWLSSEYGWCEFEQITEPGFWKRKEEPYTMEGRWIKEEEV